MQARRFAAALGVALVLGCVVAIAATYAFDLTHHDLSRQVIDLIRDHHVLADPVAVAGLRARRVDLVGRLEGILNAAEGEDRDLTAEEQTEFDKLKGELTSVEARLGRAEFTAAANEALDQVVPGVGRRQGIIHPPGPGAAREFESVGEFLGAVLFNQNDPRLHFVENAGVTGEDGQLRGEMRMDNGPSGGFMIPPQLSTTIMRVEPQAALVRPRANVIPAGSPPDAEWSTAALDQDSVAFGKMYGGVQVNWIGEGDDKPETDAKLRMIKLAPHEVAGHMSFTDKQLRNWTATATFAEGLMRDAVNAAEDDAFVRGNGVSQPLGALNATATRFVNRAQANKISYLDLLAMVSRLLMRGGSPVWSASQSCLVEIATMTDPEGHYIWKPDARDGFAGTLLGYPLRWNNRQPALGSKGDVLLADWNYYLIKDGSGPYVAASSHVKFLANKTVIKIFWNVDGSPWLTAPIEEENGYQVSPFVALDVPG